MEAARTTPTTSNSLDTSLERAPYHMVAVLESSPVCSSHGPGTLSGFAPRVLAETQGHRSQTT